MNFNYSIIIPHKNIPDLLNRCLKSIPEREDTEIIIIDDNSDKNIVDFNNFPGINRNNTKVIFIKENKGAGFARNKGLEFATGKNIIFADADDFFNPCINILLDKYKDFDFDIIFFNANSVDSNTYKPSNRAKYINKCIALNKKNKDKSLFKLRFSCGQPWGKIINREKISKYNISFDETSINEDTTFSYLIGYYTENYIIDDMQAYCITYRKSSISFTLNEQKKIDMIDVFTRKEIFFNKHKIKFTHSTHFEQLCDSYYENKNTYLIALNKMKELGMSEFYIKYNLFKFRIKRYIKKSFYFYNCKNKR